VICGLSGWWVGWSSGCSATGYWHCSSARRAQHRVALRAVVVPFSTAIIATSINVLAGFVG
jgi:hypothetical protein